MSELNIRYNDSAFSQAISVMTEVGGALGNGVEAVQKAINVLNSISSAGGALASAVGGTVIGAVRNNATSVEGSLTEVKKLLNRLGNAQTIMRGRIGQAAQEALGAGFDTIRDILGDIRQEGRDQMLDTFKNGWNIADILENIGNIGQTPTVLDWVADTTDKFQNTVSDWLDQHVQTDFDLAEIINDHSDFQPVPPNCIPPSDIICMTTPESVESFHAYLENQFANQNQGIQFPDAWNIFEPASAVSIGDALGEAIVNSGFTPEHTVNVFPDVNIGDAVGQAVINNGFIPDPGISSNWNPFRRQALAADWAVSGFIGLAE